MPPAPAARAGAFAFERLHGLQELAGRQRTPLGEETPNDLREGLVAITFFAQEELVRVCLE